MSNCLAAISPKVPVNSSAPDISVPATCARCGDAVDDVGQHDVAVGVGDRQRRVLPSTAELTVISRMVTDLASSPASLSRRRRHRWKMVRISASTRLPSTISIEGMVTL